MMHIVRLIYSIIIYIYIYIYLLLQLIPNEATLLQNLLLGMVTNTIRAVYAKYHYSWRFRLSAILTLVVLHLSLLHFVFVHVCMLLYI